jgi:cell division protein FtsI/penicillin-binding protein 2
VKFSRIHVIHLGFIFFLLVILGRLFYWQVLAHGRLQTLATLQRQSRVAIPAMRGDILSSDGFPLVTNQPAYLVFAYTPDIEIAPFEIVEKLKHFLAPNALDLGATPSAELTAQLTELTAATLSAKLTNPKSSWIPLSPRVNEATKAAIQDLGIKGIGFDEFQVRTYPEASMAAQILGFVGSDGTGQPEGYFGLEGEYDLELRGKDGLLSQERDALGNPITVGDFEKVGVRHGRTLKTHLNRGLQLIVERELQKGLETYQAMSGEVVIMRPSDGAILSMASFPSYDPARHRLYQPETYRLSSIADAYEPGSTFKALVMAAAVNEGVVDPETPCDATCDGPVTIGKYTIKTWNNEYNPRLSMTEVLRRSDNTGMIFAAQRLGKDKFEQYLEAFGFGQATGIDLEGETIPQLRDKWGDIDLATGSFGQGLAVTSIQMVQAIGAIANEGIMMQPQVVDAVVSEQGEIDIAPKIASKPISKEAAKKLALMLRSAAEEGEAKFAVPKGFKLAGKTGTAQIPIAGHYDAEKTMASFIGFAPYDDPQFVMLVKLREPQASPWASETAAPLWFGLVKDVFNHLNANK